MTKEKDRQNAKEKLGNELYREYVSYAKDIIIDELTAVLAAQNYSTNICVQEMHYSLTDGEAMALCSEAEDELQSNLEELYAPNHDRLDEILEEWDKSMVTKNYRKDV